ncbi:MAG: hypothetical protein ACRC33_11540 [Gemmataceae bacterium]
MFGSGVNGFVAAGVVGFWLALTVLAAFNRPRAGPETVVFGHRWAVRILALIFGPLLSIFLAVGTAVEAPGPNEWPISAALWGGTTAVFGPGYWESIRFAFALTPEGIDYVSPWRGRWFIPWAAVRELGYTRFPGMFLVRSDAGTARVGILVPGVGKLVEACEERLPVERLKGAIDGYSVVGRYFPYPGKRR